MRYFLLMFPILKVFLVKDTPSVKKPLHKCKGFFTVFSFIYSTKNQAFSYPFVHPITPNF